MTPGSCPLWCARTGPHENHIGSRGEADGVHVSLLQDPAWPGPEIFLAIYPAGPCGVVMLPLWEAADMAVIMAGLGHRELAALITATVAACFSSAGAA
jgi:hypothetical protein